MSVVVVVTTTDIRDRFLWERFDGRVNYLISEIIPSLSITGCRSTREIHIDQVRFSATRGYTQVISHIQRH